MGIETRCEVAMGARRGCGCRLRRCILAVLVVAVLLAAWQRAFPWWVRKGLERVWRSASPEPAEFCVRSARWGRIVLTDVVVGSAAEPIVKVDRVEVSFDLAGLRRGELESVVVDGAWTWGEVVDGEPRFAVMDLFPDRSDVDATPLALSRVPVQSLRVAKCELDLRMLKTSAPESTRQLNAVLDATLLRTADGEGARLAGGLRMADTNDGASLVFEGQFPKVSSDSAKGRVSLSGVADGDTASLAVDIGWHRLVAGSRVLTLTNGAGRVSHHSVSRWLPPDVDWDGDDLRIGNLHGALAFVPKVEGMIEGLLEAGSQRLSVGSGSTVIGTSGATVAVELSVEGSVVDVRRMELLPAAWEVERGGHQVQGLAAANLRVQDALGPAGAGTVDGRVELPLPQLLAWMPGVALSPEDAFAVAISGAFRPVPSQTDESVRFTSEFRREFSWHGGEWDAKGRLEGGVQAVLERGALRIVPSDQGNPTARDVEVSQRGAEGASLLRLHVGPLALSPEAVLDGSGVRVRLTVTSDFQLEYPPYLRIPDGQFGATCAWPGANGEVTSNASLKFEECEVLGLAGVYVADQTMSFSNNVPLILELGFGIRDSAAKPAFRLRSGGGSGNEGWEAQMDVPRFALAATDPLQALVKQYVPLPSSELTGDVGGSLSVRGRLGGAPNMTVQVGVTNGIAKAEGWQVDGVAGSAELFLRQNQLRTTGEQSLRFGQLQVAGMQFDGGRMRWQLETDQVRVANAELDWLGGQLRAYALSFDVKRNDTEFVLYVDNVDVGRLLRLVKPLEGSGEGRLFGRMPVKLENGRWKLSTAYLYSMPGQEGSIRLSDTRPLMGLLAQAGVSREVRETLAEALRDFRFTTFGLELHPPAEDGETLLAVRLLGVSRDRKQPTPVNATLNLRGNLETLLNMGVVLGRLQE